MTMSGLKLFSLLFLWRSLNGALLATSFAPDEQWQSLEIAHRWVFGVGHYTWEWDNCYQLRNWVHPLIFVAYYKAVHLVFGVLSYAAEVEDIFNFVASHVEGGNNSNYSAGGVLMMFLRAPWSFLTNVYYFFFMLPADTLRMFLPRRWTHMLFGGAVASLSSSSGAAPGGVAAATTTQPWLPYLENYLIAYGPRVLVQAVIAALTEYYLYRFAQYVFQKDLFRCNMVLVCSLLSWFNWFAITRTYSSCLELFLTVAGVYHFQAEKQVGLAVFLGALACVVRPTAALFWGTYLVVATLCGEDRTDDEASGPVAERNSKASPSKSTKEVALANETKNNTTTTPEVGTSSTGSDASSKGLVMNEVEDKDKEQMKVDKDLKLERADCGTNIILKFSKYAIITTMTHSVFGLCLDSACYRLFHEHGDNLDHDHKTSGSSQHQPVNTLLNFFVFNLLKDGGAAYGTHNIYWYFLDGLGGCLTTYLPLALYGFFKIFPARGGTSEIEIIPEESAGATTSATELQDKAEGDETLSRDNENQFFQSSHERNIKHQRHTTPTAKKRLRPVLFSFFVTLLGLSLASHKEHRFLMPVTWVCHLLAAEAGVRMWNSGRQCRTGFFFVFLFQIACAVFFGFLHQRGGDKVLHFFRDELWRMHADAAKLSAKRITECDQVGRSRNRIKGEIVKCVEAESGRADQVLKEIRAKGQQDGEHLVDMVKERTASSTSSASAPRTSNANNENSTVNIFFATDCHEMPLYSYLHSLPPTPAANFAFLDCSPAPADNAYINSSPGGRSAARKGVGGRVRDQQFKNWRDRFVANPVAVLETLFEKPTEDTTTADENAIEGGTTTSHADWQPARSFCSANPAKNTLITVNSEWQPHYFSTARTTMTSSSSGEAQKKSPHISKNFSPKNFPYKSLPHYLVFTSTLFDHSEKQETALLKWLRLRGYTLRRSMFHALFQTDSVFLDEQKAAPRNLPPAAQTQAFAGGRNVLSYYYQMQICLCLEESCCFCMTQKVWHGSSSATAFEKLPQYRIRMTNPPLW
ncbi:unnamed protein product [Amoebophrya sp. A120]|nr:unnamed protein product [Amoebophrya sp. A120]|eukprot:GSA120T00000968001.1